MSTRSEVPPSLSIYRGQSRTGIGEGPGKSVNQGEQYLKADDDLKSDGELLTAIRPWMTLDSDPADHRRLNDRLEAWSCFSHNNLLFVTRLVSAGTYDRRAAYFAHGRAWSQAFLDGGFDPGAHIGRSEIFEKPWRDDDPGQRVPETWPTLVRPEQIQAESVVAERFLGHFLRALKQDYPLIIAVPISEFATGKPLHALVSFAWAGLPADLKRDCKIRIYTHQPELFLKHLQADLVVIPERIASEALAIRRDATLLDREGNVKAGPELDDKVVLAYAQTVTERALKIPDGLLLFGERFSQRYGSQLPDESELRSVMLIYNLAFAMASSEAKRGELFKFWLEQFKDPDKAKKFEELRWEKFIRKDEWDRFPHPMLLDFILRDTDSLILAERKLQRVVENAAGEMGLIVDERLAEWWDPTDSAKLRRLVELLAHEPPLVSEHAGAEKLSHIPIKKIVDIGPIHGVLKAEFEAGIIARRQQESADLAELASDKDAFKILAKATAAQQLDPTWATAYVNSTDQEGLHRAADYFFSDDPQCWKRWNSVPKFLLDRLRSPETAPAKLREKIIKAGEQLNLLENLDLYVRLADLVALIDNKNGSSQNNSLFTRLWKQLPALEDDRVREYLVKIALDGGWHFIQPESLVNNGELALPWLNKFADLLTISDLFCRKLGTAALLRLFDSRSSKFDKKNLEQLYETLDEHMRQHPQESTPALIEQNWWYGWRHRTTLTETELRQAALAWLGCDVWSSEEAPEATLETWKLVIKDLSHEGISGAEMQQLRQHEQDGLRTWPRIVFFENDQLTDLSRLATDLAALAELAEAAIAGQEGDTDSFEVILPVLNKSRLAAELPEDGWLWLLDSKFREGRKRPSLNLEQSAYLYQHAGHRQSQAIQARTLAVIKHLDSNLSAEGFEAAASPNLWEHNFFLEALARWMCRRGSLAAMGEDIVAKIDQSVALSPVRHLIEPPFELARELVEYRYTNAAEFLYPGISDQVQRDILPRQVIRALSTDQADEQCWQELVEAVRQQPLDRHPLTEVAHIIQDEGELAKDTVKALRENGWQRFEAAAEPILFQHTDGKGLPVFDLAASLLGDGALGMAALRIIFAHSARAYQTDHQWWTALFHSLHNCHRRGDTRSTDDREEAALVLICDYKNKLGETEQQAFEKALSPQAIADGGLPLTSEFGVIEK